MALQYEEDAACPGCGEPLDESLDAHAEGDYEATRMRCHACTARRKAEQDDYNEAPGLLHGVRRRGTA